LVFYFVRLLRKTFVTNIVIEDALGTEMFFRRVRGHLNPDYPKKSFIVAMLNFNDIFYFNVTIKTCHSHAIFRCIQLYAG